MREYQYCGSSKPEDWRLIALLRSVDGEGMPFEAMPVVRHHARRAASEWRNDQEAAIEIEGKRPTNHACRVVVKREKIAH